MFAEHPIYQEILENSPCISMDFHLDNFTTNRKTFTDWKTDFPRLKNFNESKYMDQMISLFGHSSGNSYVRCMLLKADEYLPLSTLSSFLGVLLDLGHTVVSTSGFWMYHRGWSYLETRNRTFDYLSAYQATRIGERDEERRERRLGELLWKKNEAARKIQHAFKEAIANPAYKMCRDRLMREFADLGS
jgi:hypothetical protein